MERIKMLNRFSSSCEGPSESCSCDDQLKSQFCELSKEERIEFAKAAVEYVIGSNYAGFADDSLSQVSHCQNVARKLSFGLNSPYHLAKNLHIMLIARLLVVDVLEEQAEAQESLVVFRILLLWQKLLAEPSIEIKEKIQECVKRHEQWNLEIDEFIRFYLEMAESHLTYFEFEEAAASIGKALDISGLNVELAGILGKRTRFQQRAVSQLILSAKSSHKSVCNIQDDDIPPNLALNDDTLLEKVALDENVQADQLSPEQLAVILALCRLEKRSEHNDDLLAEKCSAYLETILSSKLCWAVQMTALMMRSDMEKNNKRRVERACSQAEMCVKLMGGTDDALPMERRIKRTSWVLASGLEPVWNCKKIYAGILKSLGCTSEALLLFEQMEMWDHVVDCYKLLGQLEKANSVIHRLLEERPNDSMLYVYLGDINQQESYYQKALEISNGRNARAHKALGQMMLFRNQYDVAYDHLRRSLELQPIQLGVWFNAGHCAWKLEKYGESASCYHRCVTLEPDHFEAWNNLSAAYIRQGQKERAKRILQEALKFNYEHAKVWENYLLLCVDTGDFAQAIQSFHRLLDLNKRQQDDEVLTIIAKEVLKRDTADLPEELKVENSQTKSELVKLFGRIASVQSLSGEIWRLYAELKRPSGNNVTEFEKYVQLLERSVLSNSNKKDWSKQTDKATSTLSAAIELGRERLALAQMKGSQQALGLAKSLVRMSLRPMLTVLHRDQAENCNVGELAEKVTEARQLLESVS